MINITELKVCSKCNNEIMLVHFFKNTKGDLFKTCIDCRTMAKTKNNQTYYQKHKDYILEHNTNYIKNNPDKRAEIAKRFYENNKETRKQYYKEYYQKKQENKQ